jgi:hypothetical protein
MLSRRLRTASLAALLLAVAGGTLHAQLPVRSRSPLWVGTPLDDYLRLLQLTGEAPLSSRLLRPLEHEARTLALPDSAPLSRNPWRARYGSRQRADMSRFSVELYDPIVRVTSNSAVPFGANDGALWAGKGLSGAMDLGAAARFGPLTVRLAPTATWSRNEPFELGALTNPPAGTSPYADPYMPGRVDMPQRFGDAAVKTLDWGQSSIQLNGHGVRAGVGTENMWWGPGLESSLLMTNNAPGFRHAFAGTEHPVDIRIGKLEALYTVGRLEQSDYWRAGAPDSTSRRWMNALALVFEPRGAPGLYLGAIRAFYAYVPEGGLGVHDLTEVFQPFTKSSLVTDQNPSGDDRRDQMLSVFARWVFPASNVEVYGEFGRNDHNVDARDAVLEPEHASAYLLGMQKLFIQEAGFVRLGVEAISLASGLTRTVRASPTWYAHHIVTQGYTQRGQVIGAGVGPGGEGQSFRLDWYRRWGSLGGYVQRQRQNDDAYFARFTTPFNRHQHDVFLGFGARGALAAGPVDLSATLLRQKEYNRYVIRGNDVSNLHLELGAQVRLP